MRVAWLTAVAFGCEPLPPFYAGAAAPSPPLELVGPVAPEVCERNCLVVDRVVVEAWTEEHQPGGVAGMARAEVRVTDETGAPLDGIEVSARFVDEGGYTARITSSTDELGVVVFRHVGSQTSGVLTFLIDDVEGDSRTFDGTSGVLVATTGITR